MEVQNKGSNTVEFSLVESGQLPEKWESKDEKEMADYKMKDWPKELK